MAKEDLEIVHKLALSNAEFFDLLGVLLFKVKREAHLGLVGFEDRVGYDLIHLVSDLLHAMHMLFASITYKVFVKIKASLVLIKPILASCQKGLRFLIELRLSVQTN